MRGTGGGPDGKRFLSYLALITSIGRVFLSGRIDCNEAAYIRTCWSDAFRSAFPGRAQDPTSRYEKVHKIEIGGDGGWDFLEVDAANRRLYVTRGTRVVVIDVESEKVVGQIDETPGVHGVAFVPDLDRGFTSNGSDSSVTVFDTKTLKTLGKVKANGRPDIIYFEPVSRRVFTFNHGSNDTTAINPAEMKVAGRLRLGACRSWQFLTTKGTFS